ncbi:MAG TPA: putative quinol monooxygenase [Myxococcales bacterium]|nr:putative quinol monooxygenase [Myxococcales bacterium]
MLLLTAYIEVAPGDRGAIAAALPAVVAATRAEDGCEEYACYEDMQRPGRYDFVERWRDQAALHRHLATPHMAAWMEVAGPRMKAAQGRIYEIASVKELRPD